MNDSQGNSATDASNTSPANAPGAITVGATDITDTMAYYSNFGPIVDVFAPGSRVTSAWIGNPDAVNTISGTSMATPAVAGLVSYYISQNPIPIPPSPLLPPAMSLAIISKATNGKLSGIRKSTFLSMSSFFRLANYDHLDSRGDRKPFSIQRLWRGIVVEKLILSEGEPLTNRTVPYMNHNISFLTYPITLSFLAHTTLTSENEIKPLVPQWVIFLTNSPQVPALSGYKRENQPPSFSGRTRLRFGLANGL